MSGDRPAIMILVDGNRNDDLLEQLEARTLPKVQWHHEAHLRVCQAAIAHHGEAGALPVLRRAISAYNELVGPPNTDTSGYHETITRYFVMAVSSVAAVDVAALVSSAVCVHEAPLRHWSRARLFSAEARRGWVEPDLLPLPWTVGDRVHTIT